MKSRILTIVATIVVPICLNSKALPTSQKQSDSMKFRSIQKTVEHLQPALTKEKSRKLAKALERETDKHDIDWRLVIAIMFQESSLRVDPQNCLANPKRCTGDYGIGQVRYSVWSKQFNIDKKRMMTDLDYSVKVSVKVLADYKVRYGKKELNWYTRYHSGTPQYRAVYMAKINKAYHKINKHLLSDARTVASKD
jgi:hypothetical protein